MRRHPLLGIPLPHAGVDLAAPAGSPVVTTADGTVSTAAWTGGYGLLVAVEHAGGWQTRYAHLSKLNVAPGQRVRQGDVIGFVGSTGRSTGPHLHYETRVNGLPINPRR
jgi:murein DD-endopeptidase MepM/ murein hydrolase activator NlpD